MDANLSEVVNLDDWNFNPTLNQFEIEVEVEGVKVEICLYNRDNGSGTMVCFTTLNIDGKIVAGPTLVKPEQIKYAGTTLLAEWYKKVNKALVAKGQR